MRVKEISGKIGREIARRKRRKKLCNHNFSIISNSCVGGVISNSLKERFNSPTINLVIYPDEFIVFCNHLREYSKCLLEQPTKSEIKDFPEPYPVGIVRGGDYNLPDIPVRFMHYHSFEQAKAKWEERFKRINYNNIFILMEHGMNASKRIMDKFESLPFENKVFLSCYPQNERWPHNYNFSYYTKELYKEANIYYSFNVGVAQYRWLDEFDYTAWLNTGIIQADTIMKKQIEKQIKELK